MKKTPPCSNHLPQAICDAEYRIIAWTMNCPGSQNDRTAFKFSGFHKLLKHIPEGHYILGDAAYVFRVADSLGGGDSSKVEFFVMK